MCAVIHSKVLADRMAMGSLRTLVLTSALLLASVRALQPGSFWHITDYHYDFTYGKEGYSCTRTVSGDDLTEFGIRWCDSPWALVNSSVYAMRALEPNADFIIWTGDTVFHTKKQNEHLSTEINLDILQNVTRLLAEVFPNTVTYPAYGNHDYFPDSQFPAAENALYRRMAKSWRVWLNSSSVVETLLSGGYYTTRTGLGNIRLVSLNTNLYYTLNKQVANIDDPSGQFEWLDSVLTAASTNQEQVLLIGHVPPGVFIQDGILWFYEDYNRRLNELIQKHAGVIAALHFGHDHMDEFKVYYKDDKPAIPMFLAPSVTPWRFVSADKATRARNPGIKLVKYDRDTGKHLDYVQYYFDLDKANSQGQASWKILYEAKKEYNVPNLSAESLGRVRERMMTPGEGNPTQRYFTHMVLDGDTDTKCDTACRDATYCGMRHFDLTTYKDCLGQMGEVVSATVRPLSVGLSVLFMAIISLFLATA